LRRLLRRSAAILLVVPALSLMLEGHSGTLGPTTAYAQFGQPSPTPTASCSADPSGLGCGADSPSPSASSSSGSGGDCTWKEGGSSVVWIYGDTAPPASSWPWLDGAEYNSVIAWMDSHAPAELGTPPYLSMGVVFCPDPTVAGVFGVGTLQTAPTAANVLGLWALSQVPWVPPNVGTSPPLLTAAAVVNLPTYVYLNPGSPGAFENIGTTATAGTGPGAVSATVTAVPQEVVWTTDGDSFTCDVPEAPGVPYDPSYGTTPPADACTYTYTATGTYTLSATVMYEAAWTSKNAGDAYGDLGLVPGATVTEQITVKQIASVITAG
jgi:hypothetical protein